MRKIKYLLKKEFRQIFRNRAMLPIIFVMPVVQLLILVNAATFEIKNIQVAIVDEDMSQESRELVNKLLSTGYYQAVAFPASIRQGQRLMDHNKIDLFIQIPAGFAADLQHEGRATIGLDISAIDGSAASIIYFYTNTILADYNSAIMARWLHLAKRPALPVELRTRYLFNEELEYKNYITPGLMVVLVTMVTMFLAAMNIVREKELGTIEQLNVTPITKTQFIISKLLPFWLIGMFELAFGLAVGKLIFDFPIEGSLPLLFAFAAIYMPVGLALGLLISTVTHTQQQAMLISWFFVVIFILMSGLFTAIENMPDWAQTLTLFNPVAYFMQLIRMVLLKGSEFHNVVRHFVVIGLMAVAMLTLAVVSYRKQQ